MSHAKLSASGSHRWLACPGSVTLSEKAPPSETNKYSEEGTKAHGHLEECLTLNLTLKDLEKLCPKEMADYVYSAAQEIFTRAEGADTLLCETKVDLSFIAPDMFGTVDAAIVREFGRLTVIDFKYGQGIVVDPEDNPQLLYYALGIAHKYHYNFSEVEIVIIQPRAEDERGPVREWVTSIDTLLQWAEKFRDGAKRAMEPNAPLVSDPAHCKWCPAAVICPKLADDALAQARLDFAPLAKPKAEYMEPQGFSTLGLHLPTVLDAIPKIEEWISAVNKHAFQLLSQGGEIPGWKLVEKKGIRRWTKPADNMADAVERFGTQVLTEPELLSPAQLEKLKIKGVKEFVAENAACISSGLVMVPESDKRSAFDSIEKDFGHIQISESDWKKAKPSRKDKK